MSAVIVLAGTSAVLYHPQLSPATLTAGPSSGSSLPILFPLRNCFNRPMVAFLDGGEKGLRVMGQHGNAREMVFSSIGSPLVVSDHSTDSLVGVLFALCFLRGLRWGWNSDIILINFR